MDSMKKMATVVDNQNKKDANYISMSPSYDTIAFKAACDLVFKGKVQPSGYTEPVLHARRIELKIKKILISKYIYVFRNFMVPSIG